MRTWRRVEDQSTVLITVASGAFVNNVSVGSRAWLREDLRTMAALVAEDAASLLGVVGDGDDVTLRIEVYRTTRR